MITVNFFGWQDDLLKISLMQLIRTKTGLSLHASKQYVDDLVDGQTFFVQVSTIKDAEELVEEATRIGAKCRIDPMLEIQERPQPQTFRQKKVFEINS
jgi:hypothetical protein